MTEPEVFAEFVRKWVASAEPARDRAIRRLEEQLALTLPAAYRRFVAQHGVPYCPSLLGAIVEGSHDLHDVQEFIAVDEVAETIRAHEAAGMESGFVVFATDCMGNLFLFRKADCASRADDAPVWFFDHDFVSIEEEAPSFVEWLRRYAEIEAVAEG